MNEATTCDSCKKMRMVDEGQFVYAETDKGERYMFICGDCLPNLTIIGMAILSDKPGQPGRSEG